MLEEKDQIKWSMLIEGLGSIGEKYVANILGHFHDTITDNPDTKLLDRDRRGLTITADELEAKGALELTQQLRLIVKTYEEPPTRPTP